MVTEDMPVSVGNLRDVVDALVDKVIDEINSVKETYAYFSYYYRKVDTSDYRPELLVKSSNNIVVSDGGGGYRSKVTATLPKGTYEVTEAGEMKRVTADSDGFVLSFTTYWTDYVDVTIIRIA